LRSGFARLVTRILGDWRAYSPGQRYLLVGLVGVVVGMGLYLIRISNLLSYLSDDPRACINCHIMYPEYATWQHSSHARDTTCNDCHVPHHSVIAKYRFKAEDGLRHSAIFTLGLEPQVIRARPEAIRVINQNCLRCHTEQLAHTNLSFNGRLCFDCHREIPHGRVHSLSSAPNAAVPPLEPVLPPGWIPGSPDKSGGSR